MKFACRQGYTFFVLLMNLNSMFILKVGTRRFKNTNKLKFCYNLNAECRSLFVHFIIFIYHSLQKYKIKKPCSSFFTRSTTNHSLLYFLYKVVGLWASLL